MAGEDAKLGLLGPSTETYFKKTPPTTAFDWKQRKKWMLSFRWHSFGAEVQYQRRVRGIQETAVLVVRKLTSCFDDPFRGHSGQGLVTGFSVISICTSILSICLQGFQAAHHPRYHNVYVPPNSTRQIKHLQAWLLHEKSKWILLQAVQACF